MTNMATCAAFHHSDFMIHSSFVIRASSLTLSDRIFSAFSSVSLLPMSSHWPLIWNVFTGFRV